MNERKFYPSIIHSFEDAGGWAYRIPDMPFIKDNPRMRFTPKKPFDIIAVLDGIAYYIEVKYSKGISGISDKKLSEYQKEALYKIQENQGYEHGNIRPLVFYICYIPRIMKRLYIIPLSWIENLISKRELETEISFMNIVNDRFDASKINEFTLYKKGLFNGV